MLFVAVAAATFFADISLSVKKPFPALFDGLFAELESIWRRREDFSVLLAAMSTGALFCISDPLGVGAFRPDSPLDSPDKLLGNVRKLSLVRKCESMIEC